MTSFEKPSQPPKAVGGEHLENEYYERYNSVFDLEMMNSRIQNIQLPEDTASHIREQDRNTFLVLGSATTKNINGVTKIVHYLHGKESTPNDFVVIVDINDTSIALHERAIRELDEVDSWSKTSVRESGGDIFPYPQFKVEKDDIRSLSQEADSIDVAISDYTINYLDSEEDVMKFFSEVHRVLKEKGIMYIALRYLKDSEFLQKTNQGGAEICTLSLDEYKRLAQEAGLNILANDASGGGDALFVFGKV